MSGLTSTGFTKLRAVDIVDEQETSVESALGEAFLKAASTPMGKLIGIYAEREALIWDALEAVYDGQYVDSAGGVSQDKAYAMTGHYRQNPLQSTVTLYCAGTASTVIPKDSTVSVVLAGDYFQLKTAVTLGTIANKTISGITRSGTTATATTSTTHGLAAGAYVFVTGAVQTDYNILAVVIAVPTTTTFTYTVANSPASPATTSTAFAMDEATAVEAESVEYDAIQALSGTLTVIENPITGWDRVENLLDASTGRLEETDAAFRSRRESSLALIGSATVEAIAAALLNVTSVTSAVVYENPTGITDGDGRPPYSIECLVAGGTPADICENIFENKAGGIETYGNQTPVVHQDSQGIDHTIEFSRLTEVPMYHALVITTNSDPYEGAIWDTVNGETNLLAAIVNFYDDFAAGQNVKSIPYLMAAIGAIDGIKTISLFTDRSAAPTTDTEVVIASNEIATADSSDITGTIDGAAI
ncbi:MAG: hypothetical protein HOD85_12750 [Deltaproteobacteria bacterium]|nr:hypothetical protein [Deltaproteobacteria bacterium]